MQWTKRDNNAPTDRADFVICWVKDLLKPDIKQTKGVLHNFKTGGFCCLGVACETAGLEKKLNVSKGCYFYEDENVILPSVLESFLNIDDQGVIINWEIDKKEIYTKKAIDLLNKKTALAEANDEGASFYKISKCICSYPRAFFSNLTDAEERFITGFANTFPTWGEYCETRKAARAKTSEDKGSQVQT